MSHVINPDQAPTMGGQVTITMKSGANPLASQPAPPPQTKTQPVGREAEDWMHMHCPSGWEAESHWNFCRTMHYALRVVAAAAISTLLVLRQDTIDALHPASDTASFLMPVFAIIAAEPTVGDTLRGSFGCAVASLLYAIICWTQIQLMNQMGIGDSAWAYIFCMFFTSFGCLLSPFSVYVKRIFLGMYLLIMVKNLEMKDADTQYWKYPWYFGLSVCAGCFMAIVCMCIPTPCVFKYPHRCRITNWRPRLAVCEATHHASRAFLAGSRAIKALLLADSHPTHQIEASIEVFRSANAQLAGATKSAWWERAWLPCSNGLCRKFETLIALNCELICALSTAKIAAADIDGPLPAVVVSLGPDLVRIFEELAEEGFLTATEDVQTPALAMLDIDELLMSEEESAPAQAALAAAMMDICRLLNQSASLQSAQDECSNLVPVLKETFALSAISRQNVLSAAKISLAAAIAASIGDGCFADKLFGWTHTLANGFWAPLTVAFIFNESVGAGLLRTLQRWTGTVIACIYTLMVYYWWIDTINDKNHHQLPIVFMMMPVTFFASCFRCMNPEVGYAGAVCAFTTAIAMIGANKVNTGESVFSSSDIYIVSRMQQTFIGVTCLTLCNTIIFPTYAHDSATAAPAIAVNALADLINLIPKVAEDASHHQPARKAAYSSATSASKDIAALTKEALAEPNFCCHPLNEQVYLAMAASSKVVCERANSLAKFLSNHAKAHSRLLASDVNKQLQVVQISSAVEGIADALQFHRHFHEEDSRYPDTEFKLQKALSAALQAVKALEAQAAQGSHCHPAISFMATGLAEAVVDLSHQAHALYAEYCAES